MIPPHPPPKKLRSLLSADTLYDLEDDDELLWRREGEEWDAPPEGEGAGGGEEAVQLNDVLAELSKAERWVAAHWVCLMHLLITFVCTQTCV